MHLNNNRAFNYQRPELYLHRLTVSSVVKRDLQISTSGIQYTGAKKRHPIILWKKQCKHKSSNTNLCSWCSKSITTLKSEQILHYYINTLYLQLVVAFLIVMLVVVIVITVTISSHSLISILINPKTRETT